MTASALTALQITAAVLVVLFAIVGLIALAAALGGFLAGLLRGREISASQVRRCRVCGCTDEDCSQCIEKTGHPCWWVEPDLCSACYKPRRVAGAAMYPAGGTDGVNTHSGRFA